MEEREYEIGTSKTNNTPGGGMVHNSKQWLKKAGMALAGLVVVAGLGWWFYDLNDTVAQLRADNAELQSTIDSLQVTGESADAIEPADDDSVSAAVSSCEGGSEYSAEIGLFEVILSDPNVVVRSLDGGFEGGPITSLSVGQCAEGETNVVDTYPTSKVDITGHPSSSADDLRAAFESEWGSPLTADGTVDIDGVTADIYTGSGLFDTKVLYFDNDGIGYEIELPDVNSTSEAILDDLIDDWSFSS